MSQNIFDFGFNSISKNKISVDFYDYNKACQEFITYYYKLLSSEGIKESFYLLFDRNVLCHIENVKYIGPHNLLLFYITKGLCKFKYEKLSFSYQPLKDKLLIHTTGLIKGISQWNTETSWLQFTEIFILEKQANTFKIINYIIKTAAISL
jgi:hypothetical protein